MVDVLKQLATIGGGAAALADDVGIANLTLTLARCPHCMTANPTLNQIWRTLDKPLKPGNGGPARHWHVYVCTTCAGLVTVTGTPDAETVLMNMPLMGIRVAEMYPSLPQVHPSIPDSAARYLTQALETLQSPDASLVMSASAIDAMLRALDLSHGSLYERLTQAVARQLMPKSMGDWAHRVRLDANAVRHADHAGTEPSRGDAERAAIYAQAIGHYLFVLPSLIPASPKNALSSTITM